MWEAYMKVCRDSKKCCFPVEKFIAQILEKNMSVCGRNLKISLLKSEQQKGQTAKKGQIKSGKFQTGLI